MKKIINEPVAFVDEMLDGVLIAHHTALRTAGGPRAIVRADAPVRGKVGLAPGGGSGHLPVFLGYVGQGLLDGCAVGNAFASPNAEQMLDVTRAIDGGQGVLYIYGNYGGDVMNFDMATEMAALVLQRKMTYSAVQCLRFLTVPFALLDRPTVANVR